MSEIIKPEGKQYSAEQWHLYCKSRWLGVDETKLPNGKVLLIPKSTADLDVSEFNDYMTAVEVWAHERGCFLEDAGIFS